jgi:hypothetical protein
MEDNIMKRAASLAALLLGTCATVSVAAETRAIGKIIYRVAGVINSGGADEQFGATVVPCTNISGNRVRMQVILRDKLGAVMETVNYGIAGNATVTFSTKRTLAYQDDIRPLVIHELEQGSMIIRATSSKVICSATQVDASSDFPSGAALHMVRFNPIRGAVE